MTRYPAYPLITHDPYFSIWSFSDKLTETWTHHWTGNNNDLCGLLRIDGKTFRFMGPRQQFPPMNQESVEVFPTRTVYTFTEAGVRFRLTFVTPALPHKLDVMARPITYVCYDIESTDGAEHELSVYLAATADACVNENSAKVTWSRLRKKDMDFLSIGAANQAILQKTGDNIRIKEKGDIGVNGGPNGDLILEINVSPSKSFTRKGADVYTNIPISVQDALLGSTVTVNTVNGTFDLNIPSCTEPNTILKMQGQGITLPNGKVGDQYCTVSIKFPKKLNKKQQDLITQFAEEEDSKGGIFNWLKGRRKTN